MVLFFNTKLVNKEIYEDNKNTYYPVMMPKNFVYENKYQLSLEILKTTLISYSKLKLTACYFYIELNNENNEIEIKELILNLFSSKTIEILSFYRPSKLNDWKNSISKLSKYKSIPIITVFNHDHPFVDYQQNTFYNIIRKVFNNTESNFKKVFIYSHVPEATNVVLNLKRYYGNLFKVHSDNLYKAKINYTIDSFAIMTYDTLNFIFESVIKYPDYIGRIDWQGLYFKKLNLDCYVYLREFFCHYEGYSHVTGSNLYCYIDPMCFDKNNIGRE